VAIVATVPTVGPISGRRGRCSRGHGQARDKRDYVVASAAAATIRPK
jgi:hypothetical protein